MRNKNSYKILNEVLLNWGDNKDLPNGNTIIDSEKIKEQIEPPYKILTTDTAKKHLDEIEDIIWNLFKYPYPPIMFQKNIQKLEEDIIGDYWEHSDFDYDTYDAFHEFITTDVPDNTKDFFLQADLDKEDIFAPWVSIHYKEEHSGYMIGYQLYNRLKENKYLYSCSTWDDNPVDRNSLRPWRYCFFIYKTPISDTDEYLYFLILCPHHQNKYGDCSLSILLKRK